MNGPVHKYYLKYSRTLVGYHTQLQKKIHRLSQKVTYAYKIIYMVIDGLSPNYVSSSLHICDHSIVTIDIRENCLGL